MTPCKMQIRYEVWDKTCDMVSKGLGEEDNAIRRQVVLGVRLDCIYQFDLLHSSIKDAL